ncbi:MAG TPA: fatty acid desaturase [Crinalium sp.]
MGTSRTAPNALNRDLRLAVADLETVNPWMGVYRFSILGIVFLGLVALAWTAPNMAGFLGYTAIAGIFYAFWLICTHDATHHTLTGWAWFDEGAPRLISWPMVWPYGAYSYLHHLHHAWNGIDLRDPERVQWAIAEYQQAPPWQQWYVRHQWWIDLFVLGGLGLIAKTTLHALRLKSQTPVLQRHLWLDGLGILVVQASLTLIAIGHHRLLDYILFWIVLERVIGILLQTRDHLEHYALWGSTAGHQLTQLYACRNLDTHPVMAWLMGGLNDHAVHHAFPSIPFNHLPEAFCRTTAILQQHGWPPLLREQGYLQETLRLGSRPCLIGAPQPADPTGRYHMISCHDLKLT